MKTIKILSVVIAATALVACEDPVPPTEGDFRRVEKGIECVQTPPSAEFAACLHVGSLKIGSKAAEVEAVLGKPKITRPGLASERRFYTTDSAEPPAWFVIVAVDKQGKGNVSEIQLSGKPGYEGLVFSTISVGDEADKITRQLGNPSVLDCNAKDSSETWAYTPFSFSFRVKEGKVVALRVVKPLGLKNPFKPLEDKAMKGCKK